MEKVKFFHDNEDDDYENEYWYHYTKFSTLYQVSTW